MQLSNYHTTYETERQVSLLQFDQIVVYGEHIGDRHDIHERLFTLVNVVNSVLVQRQLFGVRKEVG